MKNKILFFIALLLQAFAGLAQNAEPEMADTFRSEGKIYVVISVIAISFICIVAYLIYIDIKLRKLEKNNQS